MEATASSALWFLPIALPICIWVAYSDLSRMKIPNVAVMALFAGFLVIGLVALPFDDYWRRVLAAIVVLVIGIAVYSFGGIGAGDIKFTAAMTPFFHGGDLSLILILASGVLLAAAATHRLAKRIGPIRRATPDWISWDHKKFPMGLALTGVLIFYLLLAAFLGK
jgi:prepilin peptidase CpaA